jgi:hypothetical protein
MSPLIKMIYVSFLVENIPSTEDGLSAYFAKRIRLYFDVVRQDLSVFEEYDRFIERFGEHNE